VQKTNTNAFLFAGFLSRIDLFQIDLARTLEIRYNSLLGSIVTEWLASFPIVGSSPIPSAIPGTQGGI
jgi:hypothetical protein